MARHIPTPRTAERLAELSNWIDLANLTRYKAMSREQLVAEVMTMGRIIKATEERGEAVEAWLGVIGENPRKGITHDMASVREELLDVALTALCAVEHMTGNRGLSMGFLDAKVAAVSRRAGLEST